MRSWVVTIVLGLSAGIVAYVAQRHGGAGLGGWSIAGLGLVAVVVFAALAVIGGGS